MAEHENPNTPEAAEGARQEREHGEPRKVRVQVGDTAIAVGDKTHEPGATFTADEVAIGQALARGLVTHAAEPARRRR